MNDIIWDNPQIRNIFLKNTKILIKNLKDSIDHEHEDHNWEYEIESTIANIIDCVVDCAEEIFIDNTIDICYKMNTITEIEQIKKIDENIDMYRYILDPSIDVLNYYNFKYKL